MTIRCFDTYYPGGSEKMEIFLESIMSGRYLFFAIKVTIRCELWQSFVLKAYLLFNLVARARYGLNFYWPKTKEKFNKCKTIHSICS